MSAPFRILFVCHGNICRSPLAEFVMRDLVRRCGLAGSFSIASAATHDDEIGSPVHPGTRAVLEAQGIDCSGKAARRLRRADADEWDLFVYMDDENERHLSRIFGSDPETKCVRLLAFAPGAGLVGEDGKVLPDAQDARAIAQAGANAADVADPWFTGNFDDTYRDVRAGCGALLEALH